MFKCLLVTYLTKTCCNSSNTLYAAQYTYKKRRQKRSCLCVCFVCVKADPESVSWPFRITFLQRGKRLFNSFFYGHQVRQCVPPGATLFSNETQCISILTNWTRLLCGEQEVKNVRRLFFQEERKGATLRNDQADRWRLVACLNQFYSANLIIILKLKFKNIHFF